MTIQCFVVGPLQQNTYIVSDESGEAVMIDCGALFENEEMEMARYIKDEGLTLKRLLLTHAHFDHACGVPFVYHVFGVGAEFNRADQWLYDTMSAQLKRFLRQDIPFDMPTPAGYLKEGDEITFGNTAMKCIAVPGHTPGGMAFYCRREGVLFGGDSLFPGSIGRTDFEGSDAGALIAALQGNVLTLPPETRVLTGHGPDTTIARERATNPYLLND